MYAIRSYYALKVILAGLAGEGKVLSLNSKLFIHRDTCRDVQQKLLDIVNKFHVAKSESPGINSDQLLEASRQASSLRAIRVSSPITD